MFGPLTDQELAQIEDRACAWLYQLDYVQEADVRRLAAEVRRLRSLIQHNIRRDFDHGRGCTPCDEFQKVAE